MSNMPDPFSRYGLSHLINASGTETVFGASPVSEEVVAAIGAVNAEQVRGVDTPVDVHRVVAEGIDAGREAVGDGVDRPVLAEVERVAVVQSNGGRVESGLVNDAVDVLDGGHFALPIECWRGV